MNMFRAEGAPFAVVVLVGALGWYVSTLQTSLGDRLSLHYFFNSESERVSVLRIDNISRDQLFTGNFVISCATSEENETCLDLDEEVPAQYRIVTPFNLTQETTIQVDPEGRTIKVNAWIPPSASFEVVIKSSIAPSNFGFQYMPERDDGNATMPKFFGEGIESFLIRNFDTVLVWTFITTFLMFLLYAMFQLWNSLFRNRELKYDDQKPNDINVLLHFSSGEQTSDSD